MTLTTFPDLLQGSDAWHDQRRGIVTASTVGRLVTPKTIKPATNPDSRALTTLLAAERITGWTDPVYINDDMYRGIDDEPRARDLYSKTFAPVTECGFMVRDFGWFKIGYSPDGLVGDDGLIEVKSRRQKAQLATIIDDAVPLENLAQCQGGLLVSGREWIDYVSYCGGMPLWTKRVYPRQQWFDPPLGLSGEGWQAVAGDPAQHVRRGRLVTVQDALAMAERTTHTGTREKKP